MIKISHPMDCVHILYSSPQLWVAYDEPAISEVKKRAKLIQSKADQYKAGQLHVNKENRAWNNFVGFLTEFSFNTAFNLNQSDRIVPLDKRDQVNADFVMPDGLKVEVKSTVHWGGRFHIDHWHADFDWDIGVLGHWDWNMRFGNLHHICFRGWITREEFEARKLVAGANNPYFSEKTIYYDAPMNKIGDLIERYKDTIFEDPRYTEPDLKSEGVVFRQLKGRPVDREDKDEQGKEGYVDGRDARRSSNKARKGRGLWDNSVPVVPPTRG